MEDIDDIINEKLENLQKMHTKTLKEINGLEKLNERTIKQIEAQVTMKHTYQMGDSYNDREIQCKIGYNTVKPYVSSVPKPQPTAQDTFWGDLKTKAIPAMFETLNSFTYYRGQSDFQLNLEYGKSGVFTGTSLVYQDVFDIAQSLDNVVIEEYEGEYEEPAFFYGTNKVTVTYHRIIRIERDSQVIFPPDARTAISQTPGASPIPAAPLEGSLAFGTGFFVSNEGHLLTCYHVVKDARGIDIITFGGKKCTGELIQADPANDLALLKVDTVSRGILLSESSGLAKGDEVLTLGYPLIELQGQEQKATFGRINSISGIQGDIRFIQIDVPIQPGNSGGPLLNKKGDVVGIVTSTINSLSTLMTVGISPQNVNYAVKADYALPLIRTYMNGKTSNVNSNPPGANFSEIVKQNEHSVALVIVT